MNKSEVSVNQQQTLTINSHIGLKIQNCSDSNTIFPFFQVDCPDGELGKDKILDMYSMILPVGNAKVFVDQIFRIFDKDGNGTIDFKVCLRHLK